MPIEVGFILLLFISFASLAFVRPTVRLIAVDSSFSSPSSSSSSSSSRLCLMPLSFVEGPPSDGLGGLQLQAACITSSQSITRHSYPRVEYRTLWCLLLGDQRPFEVTPPLNIDVDVDDLRELIHTKGIDTTKSTILAKDLVLWKLNESELLEPNDTFSDRVSVKLSNISKVATELGPSQNYPLSFLKSSPRTLYT
ncbi:hypothetical protein APHAL10511_000302 [Amanita phalloides]|nr:hypothetical protein APHAL10511_000302 [Amanita phalloides]